MNLRWSWILAAASLDVLGSTRAVAAELPVPCVAGACGSGVTGFVQSGQAGAVLTPNLLRVDQLTDRAILNWQSFDIGPDGKVVFQQPGATSIALNRIFQASPSRIFGSLEANGQVYLVNPNGVIFGATARVKTAGLLASTLNISDQTFAGGLLSPQLLTSGQAALNSDGRVGILGADGKPVTGPDGKPLEVEIVVEQGAQLSTTTPGGRIMLASRTVDNAGSLSAPDGQVILAAGEKVYLQASTDPQLRGLLVEVDAGGEAWNRLTGKIDAARGNVTLAGLAVNQQGRISASTSLAANGSIRLLGRDTVTPVGGREYVANRGGSVEFGAQSVTTVTPDLTDTGTAIDDQQQSPSKIEVSGRQIVLQGGASLVATGGQVKLDARRNPSVVRATDEDARIRINTGASIDVSGSDATVSLERNLVSVELRANELRDSPLQRDGALRGQKVIVDARVGTPIADVSGALAAIPRDIAERTSAGGTVSLNSQGDIVVASGASIDVSGGTVNYLGAVLQTSQLIRADGRLVDIGQADPNQTYVGVLNPTYQAKFDRWGVVETRSGTAVGRYEEGYAQGSAAGTLQFVAPSMVLNGVFAGHALAGPRQITAATAPAAGRFIIGVPGALDLNLFDYGAPSVSLVNRAPNIVVGDKASLPGPRTLELPIDFLTQGGFGTTEIYSNGRVSVPTDTPLKLAPLSQFKVLARSIDVGSDITSIGGTISLSTERTLDISGLGPLAAGILIGSGVHLDVSGAWSNDALGMPGAHFQDAGRLQLSARSYSDTSGNTIATRLEIGDGVSLLANGGAWRNLAGTLTGGKGGVISLAASLQDAAFALGSAVTVEGFGTQGRGGGTFSLEAGRVEIVDAARWASAQDFDPSSDDGVAAVRLGDSLFADHGFATFDILASGAVPDEDVADGVTSDGVVLRVAGDANLDLRTRTRQLTGDLSQRASGGAVDEFSTPFLPEESLQSAARLTLRTEPRGVVGASKIGSLEIEQGSVISAPARSTVTLASPGGLRIDGQIATAGGTIAASVLTPPDALDAGYDPQLRLLVDRHALLDVSGKALLKPNDAGLNQGELLAGGRVELAAERGSVNVASGARIDARGATAELDVPSAASSTGSARELISSAGGDLVLRAPESLVLQGSVQLDGGAGGALNAEGGSLTLQLTRNRGFRLPQGGAAATFPTTPRVLRIIPDALAADTLPNGLAVIEAARIAASGADQVTLESSGAIAFDANVRLAVDEKLVLDSPQIDIGAGAPVRLTAPLVQLGSSLATNVAPATPVAGGGQLEISAQQIDLLGSSTVQHAADVHFTSSGDIRLRGVEDRGTSKGLLWSAGNLSLEAQRIYPTTLSDFELRAQGPDSSTLSLNRLGAGAVTPLSAGGTVRLTADRIVQSGRLYAPFGSLLFNASESVEFGAGSLTSVSASGTTLLFGRVELGNEWQYNVGATLTVRPTVPERAVDITAPSVSLASDAVVDLSGGGDLYAYSWQPGTGGSVDALAPGKTPGLYAVLPSLRGGFAPYDPQEYFGSDLTVGDSVYLSGTAGLEAGFYPLLPARYALLPGAYLVSAVDGYAALRPGYDSTLADGTPVVAGYRSFANTQLGDGRYTGFAVRPGSYGRTLASYEDFRASTFYPALATRLELDDFVRTADAGRFGLNLTRSLQGQGQLRTAAATGGTAATIDVSADLLQIGTSGDPVADGVVRLDPAVLERWGASSLLLGGRRSSTDGSITVSSKSVTFLDGAHLTGDEVIAVANERIVLNEGAVLTTRSPAASLAGDEGQDLLVRGDAAVLAISDRDPQSLVRSNTAASGGGRIDLASGSTVSTGGSLLLDAPNGGTLDGTLTGRNAVWTLGSRHLTFGETVAADGLTLDGALIAALEQGAEARLVSRTTIDFASATQIGGAVGGTLKTLTLEANGLRALDDLANVALIADSVRLRGASGQVAAADPTVDARFSVTAHDLTLQDGTLRLRGFDTTSLQAAGDVLAEGAAGIDTVGNLELTAARFTTATGANASVAATGDVHLGASGGTASATAPGLGGSLVVTGRDIDIDGRVMLPSGALSVSAARDLSLGAGAVLDASGRLVTAADRTVASPGGSIVLGAGGALDLAAGSAVRVDAAGSTDGGSLRITAGGTATLQGVLQGRAAGDARGASISVQADRLANFAELAAQVESGGFGDARSVRVAQGDLELGSATTWTARDVELIADTGSVRVAGDIVAQGAEGTASRIILRGAQGVALQTGGSLAASGTGELGRGGSITLESRAGDLSLAAGSTVTADGTLADGSLTLRARALGNDVAIASLDADVRDVEAVRVEPFLSFDVAGSLDEFAIGSYLDQAVDYGNNAAAPVTTRLQAGRTLPLRFSPTVELNGSGDLTLGSEDVPLALDLTAWRVDTQPVNLAIRTSGDLSISGLLSDGIAFDGTSGLEDVMTGDSATLRLTAGRDLRLTEATVRTGTGNLELTAARDLVFGGDVARAYTTGAALLPSLDTGVGFVLANPVRGGALRLSAGRDVIGNAVTQDVGSWQMRQGEAGVLGTRWGNEPVNFRWNAGTLGGGDVVVHAGRDLREFAAAAADSAYSLNDKVIILPGGRLDIDTGRDISSSFFHVSTGENRLRAGGSLSRTRRNPAGGVALGSLLSMQDARLSIAARGGIALESVFNPTMLAQPLASGEFISYFFTYGADSALELTSVVGDISTAADSVRVGQFIGDDARSANFEPIALALLPPSLTAHALSGSVSLTGTTRQVMFPSDRGQLDIFATKDVVAKLQMSDAAATSLSAPETPASVPLGIAAVDKRAASARHRRDSQPVLISAGRDVMASAIELPKASRIVAGRDIVDLTLTGQNIQSSDQTLLSAGRDVRYTRTATTAGIAVGGPGRVDVLAERDVDLGFSRGVSTLGRLSNPTLPVAGGADVSIIAGLSKPMDAAGFTTAIISPSEKNRRALLDYVGSVTGTTTSDFAAARDTFLSWTPDRQRPLLLAVFFGELVQAGRDANTDPASNFAQGYAAIDKLLPGSRKTASDGESWVNPYEGALGMAFSRIYTLDGGNINILVPGGGIDVGLAVPPAAGAPTRKPSELGIVAQRAGAVRAFASEDVLVNASRVFTLQGGSIVIWSTTGDIDAGRGAKSAISAPAPTLIVSADGSVTVDLAGAVAGSGIRSILTDPSLVAGDVDLIAPAGIVNAGDAGIGAAGNLNVAAQQVVGLDNIQVGGSSTGVPAETSSLGASLSGVSATSTSASAAAGEGIQAGNETPTAAPLAESVLGWLDVFVEGFGEEVCKPNDAECLERSRKK